MSAAGVLVDGFGRVREIVHRAVDGLTPDHLTFRIDDTTNSIAWLAWHLTRIQDDHIADAAGLDQVWTAGGFSTDFGLPFDPSDTGYGHDTDDVAAVHATAEQLTAYHDAVHEQSIRYVSELIDGDLSRIVDERWDPPVSLGVRLVSVLSDGLQHAGQAALVRGIVLRR
jgi:hypothetical protein